MIRYDSSPYSLFFTLAYLYAVPRSGLSDP